MTKRKVSAVALFLSLFSLLYHTLHVGSVWGQAAGSEVHRALETNRKVRVVIALRRPIAPYAKLPSRLAEIRNIRSNVLAKLGPEDFTVTHEWEAISAVAGDVSMSGLARLLANPDVVRIDIDVGGSGGLSQSVPLINADAVHALGFTGEGVTVALLDTGVDTDHSDLSNAIVGQQCFCTNSDGTGCCPNGSTQQSGSGSAEDDRGHGTNVAGIITSNGTVAPAGVAPDARIVAVKVMDSQAIFSSSAQVISGLNWIILNRPDVKVVNMSLGTFALFSGLCDNATAFTMAFADAIDTLKANGVIAFASSANDGSGSQMSAPACVANTVSVGAVYDSNVGSTSFLGCTDSVTMADKVCCFSNSNSTLDLLAPGVWITSTGLGGGTSTFGGTSMASAHAAGAAALLLQVKPTATPDDIETALKATGVPVTDPKNGLVFPRIDVLAAVDALEALPVLSVTPPSLAFGSVAVGASKDLSFTVQNIGGGTLTGSASTSMPFNIIGDNSFNLNAGGSKLITVRFSPTSVGNFLGNVNFTSNGGNTSPPVSGTGTVKWFTWPIDPSNISKGHDDFCADWPGNPRGCYWLSDAPRPGAAEAWRDAQPFRRHKNKKNKKYHLGADYNFGGGADDKGQPVYPTTTGIVVAVLENVCGWGNIIFLNHDTPFGVYTSMYAHVDWLSTGQPGLNATVTPNAPIAQVGNGAWTKTQTCGSKGKYPYHLHFEIRQGTSINPGSGYIKNNKAKVPDGQVDPNQFVATH